MHSIINYLTNLPPSTWTSVLSFLGGSAVIATILQFIKKKFNMDEMKKLVVALAGIFSYIAASASYLLTHAATSPLPTIAGNGTKLLALATLIHRFAVSPAGTKLASVNANTVQPWLQAVAKTKAEIKAAKGAETAPTTPDVPETFQVQG